MLKLLHIEYGDDCVAARAPAMGMTDFAGFTSATSLAEYSVV